MATTAELEEIAARARDKYPEYDVAVVCCYLLRATWREAVTAVLVEATTEELLTVGIARQVRMRELDAMRTRRAR